MRRNHAHSWRNLVAYNKQKVPIKVTEGQTFLKAASLKRLRLLRMMVDGGVDVNFRDSKGHTAIICVILSTVKEEGQASSSDTIVEYLLRKGADPNIQDFNGKTALIHVCQQSLINTTILQLLLMYKADPLIKDLLNRDVFSYVKNDLINVKTMLLEACDNDLSRSDGILKHTNSFESESKDMYTYLFVPDNANKLSRSFLTLPQPHEAKWSPKMNRRKPFYCVEELDMQYDNDGETEGIILKCPDIRRMSKDKRGSVTEETLPKVQLSNENGETRLLFGLPSTQFELERMKTSLFDWERQLSQDEDNDDEKRDRLNVNNTLGVFTQKFRNKIHKEERKENMPYYGQGENELKVVLDSKGLFPKIKLCECPASLGFNEIMQIKQVRAYSAPSVLFEECSNTNESLCMVPIGIRNWHSTSNVHA